MMKRQALYRSATAMLLAASLLGGGWLLFSETRTATSADMIFDSQGQKIFQSYDSTPLSYMSADSGDRNLAHYYSLRQYPGAPPRIPHPVEPSFSETAPNCLSCHARGGFSPEHAKFIPLTPHPEEESCRQCHVPQPETDQAFVQHDWQSLPPPRLGVSALGGSPPVIPHALQLREDCVSCHTGPGGVVEIRVEHSARGNCRQCHMVLLQTEQVKVFTRKEQIRDTP
jgi:nitrate reductase (cytochrome), electron transfer subunit